ncbi:hypothetical protein KBY91_26190 [Streptomyces sp. RK23]|uniref:hypothetical protein n=1 Tax=Streptomyces TaxID=1883 RepID=UPI001B398B4D|nr:MULTISPECIES: hypothetical protein [unclassified Streptomyces]MBQ0966961.1 hypothetical protein [Streptomyces sp. RK74B]MBQ1006893.1 hypothetical protein [Streptomyces sp. RK23]
MFSIGAVRVPFAVWIRDVDESGSGDDLDAAYEQGERGAGHVLLCEVEGSPLAAIFSGLN